MTLAGAIGCAATALGSTVAALGPAATDAPSVRVQAGGR